MERGYFRLSVHHIKRDTKNIVASASYRSDEELYSERTDEKIKFKNHTVKPQSMILTPENAPDWANNRERLWNEVDKVEKRNSKTQSPRLATEVLLSLPNDLDREVQTEMTKEYVYEEFVSKGMVADISIHRDDINNPHAHVLLTTRPFTENKEWGKKVKTQTQYDEYGYPKLNKNGNKIRKQVRALEIDLNQIRKNWSDKLNYFSERESSLRRYDHRSFEQQGLNKIAEIPLTREEYRLEKREEKRCKKNGIAYIPVTYYGRKNEQIRRYNRGEVSELFTDREKEKAQEEFNYYVDIANKSVEKDTRSYKVLKARYKGNVGYIEAKETLRNTFDTASTFGRKIKNDLIKNSIEQQYLIYKAEKFDNDKSYRKSVLENYTPHEFKASIENDFRKLLDVENNLLKKEEKRSEIYQSAKNVFDTEKEKNNAIVKQIYSNSYNEFNDDEKAFIVLEGHKGNFIKDVDVQKLFKESKQIPNNIYAEDVYKKASLDIFFSKRKLNSYNISEKDMFIESMFIKEKEKELSQYEEFINDDLSRRLSTGRFKDIENNSPYYKSQLILKLDKYNNLPNNEILEKHDRDYKESSKYEDTNQRNAIKNSTLNLSEFLSIYANNVEYGNNASSKKRKKNKRKNLENNRHL